MRILDTKYWLAFKDKSGERFFQLDSVDFQSPLRGAMSMVISIEEDGMLESLKCGNSVITVSMECSSLQTEEVDIRILYEHLVKYLRKSGLDIRDMKKIMQQNRLLAHRLTLYEAPDPWGEQSISDEDLFNPYYLKDEETGLKDFRALCRRRFAGIGTLIRSTDQHTTTAWVKALAPLWPELSLLLV